MSLTLELVLGVTSCDNASLAQDPSSSLVAFPAAGVLVLLDTNTNLQVNYLVLQQNTFTAASFSQDGRLIVTGEMGRSPAVRVWSVKECVELAALLGHTHGVRVVRFSPVGDEIVSVGFDHDNLINVWAWPDAQLIATNNSLDQVANAAYSKDGSFFVTVGRRHVKFWYPKHSDRPMCQGMATSLYGRAALLCNGKDNVFVDVDCGEGSTSEFVFAVTQTGKLAILQASSRRLKELIALEGGSITCVKLSDVCMCLGLSNGEVHLMNSQTLKTLVVLPGPESRPQHNSGVRCLAFNARLHMVTVVYTNKSLSVWHTANLEQPEHKFTCMFHRNVISGSAILSQEGEQARETLVTSSHDCTVRIWDLVTSDVLGNDGLTVLFLKRPPDGATGAGQYVNAHLNEKVTAMEVIPESNLMVLGTEEGCVYIYSSRHFLFNRYFRPHQKEVTCFAHIQTADRCLLACGSRDRTIKVLDAKRKYNLLATLKIHSSSITKLLFVVDRAQILLISCAMDRTVNLCTCKAPITTTITNTATAAAVNDAESGDGRQQQQQQHHHHQQQSSFYHATSRRTNNSPADMALDRVSGSLAVGIPEGRVSVCRLPSLEELRVYRGCQNESAHLHKILLHPEGRLLVTASSDRLINLLDFTSGLVLASVSGNNHRVTSLVFTANARHIISASSTGCLFAWRLDKPKKAKESSMAAAVATGAGAMKAVAGGGGGGGCYSSSSHAATAAFSSPPSSSHFSTSVSGGALHEGERKVVSMVVSPRGSSKSEECCARRGSPEGMSNANEVSVNGAIPLFKGKLNAGCRKSTSSTSN